MKPTLSFAIKASIAATLLDAIIFMILLFVGDAFNLPGLSRATQTASPLVLGIIVVILTYITLYISTRILLKNTKFTKQDRSEALKYTWMVYIGAGVVLSLLNVQGLIAEGWVSWITQLASYLAAYLAVYTLQKTS